MASKYSKKFTVPPGFPEILHNLTREVLRDQPDDLVEYAALYFECLHEKKPFHYESKYNVKADNPQDQFAPQPKKDFDSNQPPKKDKAPPKKSATTEVKEELYVSKSHSHQTIHKEEKVSVSEYASGRGALNQSGSPKESKKDNTLEDEEGKSDVPPKAVFKYYCSDVNPQCFPVTYFLKRYDIPYEKYVIDGENIDRPLPILEDKDENQEVSGLSNCLLYICKKFEIEDTLSPNILVDDNEIEQFLRFFLNFEGSLEALRQTIEQHAEIGAEDLEGMEAFFQEIEEKILPNRPFLAGEEDVTLADLVVFANLIAVLATEYDFKKFPHVENWLKATLSSEIRDEFIEFFNMYLQAYELEGQNEVLAEL